MRVWKHNCGVVAHLVFMIGCLTLGWPLVALKNDAVVVPPNDKQPAMPPAPTGMEDAFFQALPEPGKKPLVPPAQLGKDDAAFSPPAGFDEPPPVPPGFEGGRPPVEDRPPLGMPPSGDSVFRGARPRDPDNRAQQQRMGSNRPGRGAAAQRNNAAMQDDDDPRRVVPQNCVIAKDKFKWNFEDEKLINILRQVSGLLCRNITVNDSIPENLKLTIIGQEYLTPNQAWDVTAASLAAKGFALIEQGMTWTVIKRNESKSYSTPMYEDPKFVRNNEEIGTLFYKVQHAPQDVLKNVARVLLSKDGIVESVGDQFIIVIDSNSNIRRLGRIFSQVDIEDAINKVHIITLNHADARTFEKQLREIFDISGGSAGGPRSSRGRKPDSKSSLNIDKIIADERTNSLIVVSDKESVEKLKEVVAMIDQPSSDQGSKGKIHVKKLKYADAKKIAETLTAVVSQGKSSRFSRRRPDDGGHELFEGEVKITAHEATNTLVTVAGANDYRALLATINKLDVRREQVYVEAVILDVEVNDKNEFGVNLFGGLPAGVLGISDGLGIAANPGGRNMAQGIKESLTAGATATNLPGLGSSGIGSLAVLGNFLSGGVAALVGPPVGDTKIPSFGAVLQAFTTSGSVDVLSTPYLLATDNQEAVMSVGEKVPVLRGTSSVGGGIGGSLGGVPFQNIAHEDVKLTFKITPHVGADDNVRLDIDQEINELGTSLEIHNQKHYRIRTKSAKTTLVLKDQQTGVIGGLIHHKSKTTDSKVPFLGDIPILGWLFKSREKDNDRRSLLLILTPYVIRTDDDYKKIVERKLKEREEFAKLYYGGKIKNYNKYVDYDKKAGPLSSLLLTVDTEMNKVENGGPGDGSDVVITPKEVSLPKESPLPVIPSADSAAIPQLNLGGRSRSNDETAHMGEEHDGDSIDLEDDFLLEDFDESGSTPPMMLPSTETGLEGSVD